MAHFTKGALRLSQLATRGNQVVVQQRNLTPPDWIRKYMYNLSGWNQYGLYKDDLMVENEVVQEAIRRLPPNLQVSPFLNCLSRIRRIKSLFISFFFVIG